MFYVSYFNYAIPPTFGLVMGPGSMTYFGGSFDYSSDSYFGLPSGTYQAAATVGNWATRWMSPGEYWERHGMGSQGRPTVEEEAKSADAEEPKKKTKEEKEAEVATGRGQRLGSYWDYLVNQNAGKNPIEKADQALTVDSSGIEIDDAERRYYEGKDRSFIDLIGKVREWAVGDNLEKRRLFPRNLTEPREQFFALLLPDKNYEAVRNDTSIGNYLDQLQSGVGDENMSSTEKERIFNEAVGGIYRQAVQYVGDLGEPGLQLTAADQSAFKKTLTDKGYASAEVDAIATFLDGKDYRDLELLKKIPYVAAKEPEKRQQFIVSYFRDLLEIDDQSKWQHLATTEGMKAGKWISIPDFINKIKNSADYNPSKIGEEVGAASSSSGGRGTT